MSFELYLPGRIILNIVVTIFAFFDTIKRAEHENHRVMTPFDNQEHD